ncbi:transglutaminase [Paenibacillus sp. J5C_2022]|uniref:transglutaminase domain-containing protein n=1 Tax=Paenibacillus sp. J5C2022 TaxID=2977129 RepID=UPI0021D0213E|nr:transglutaminase domain-containing protein [Paenibacillus sp. J5C2022]MCU6712207.1 transglutaminase [Paenibacillus sp. J5C2022]
MRGTVMKLVLLLLAVGAIYAMELKLDLFPAAMEAEDSMSVHYRPPETTQAPPAAERTEHHQVVSSPVDKEYEELELEIAEGFRSRLDRFTLSHKGEREKLSEKMGDIVRAALRRDDYSAYILESYMYTIRSLGNLSRITIEARYRETKAETAAVDRKVSETLAEIIKPAMNEHEQVKAIHDWIVTHVAYDESLTYYTAYDAIDHGQTVCQGYTLLGYKMLKESGIPVLIAEGSVNTGEHAWNMVQLDGKWYHLDMTWDDPVGADPDNGISYSYYLKSDDELRRDHDWTRDYPKAGSVYADTLTALAESGSEREAQRYGKLKLALGLHWLDAERTVSGKEQLKRIIAEAVRTGTSQLQFRYVDGSSFPDALKAAVQHESGSYGYRASYEPYGGDGSLLVDLQLQYR